MRQHVQKAAIRATNNAVNGYIPYSGIVSAGAKIMARQQEKPKKGTGRKRKTRQRLTEISRGTGKAILKPDARMNQALKKLWDYEETGLSPKEVWGLIEQEKNLTEQVKRQQDW